MEHYMLFLNFIWKNKYQPILFFKGKKMRRYLCYSFLRTTALSTEMEQACKQLNFNFQRALNQTHAPQIQWASKEVPAFYQSLHLYPLGSSWGWLCSYMTAFPGPTEGQLTQTVIFRLETGSIQSLFGEMKSSRTIYKMTAYGEKEEWSQYVETGGKKWRERRREGQ